MKQNIDIKTKAENLTLQGIEDAVTGMNQKTNWVQPNFIKFRIAAITPALVASRDSQGLGRDGPPGRARSPGTLANRFPDHPPDNLMGTNCQFIVVKSYKTHPPLTCGVLPPLFLKERGDPEASGSG